MSSRRKKECKDCDCKLSYQQFIKKQFLKIEELENEIALLRCERDSLLHENERILFNLQMLSLKSRSEDTNDSQDEKKQLPTVACTNSDRKSERYELSQEMMDKKMEIIIRKYGPQSAGAALVIQRAFRKYQINKRFKNLALNALRVNQDSNLRKDCQNSNNSSSSHLIRTNPSSTKRYSNASLQSSSSSTSSSTTNSNHKALTNTLNSMSNNSQMNCQSNGFNTPSMTKSPTMPSLQATNRFIIKKITQQPSSNLTGRNCAQHPCSVSQRATSYDVVRAREYRVGLNLFNKHPPERGIQYLFEKGFIDDVVDESKLIKFIGDDLDQSRKALRVAVFLLTKKGLSKQMIGEYLGDLQTSFNQLVLQFFVKEMDFAGLILDVALRKFQTFFRFPGEAQKIERFIERFSERYWECNSGFSLNKRVDLDETSMVPNKDDVFILSFAIIMLNTDLHLPNNKRCMTVEQWIKNLRGALKSDFKDEFLVEIYERIKQSEMKTGHDHCLQVFKVQCSLVASSRNVTLPNLCANTYRRLICFCRLHEIVDLNKKERQGQHQREVFLFNDLLLVTKVYKKGGARNMAHLGSNTLSTQLYSYRRSIPLTSVEVTLFSTHYYPFGIKISSKVEKDKTLILFNARNDTDRFKFFEDLKESIAEMHQMELIRIQSTLQKNGSPSPSYTSSVSSRSNGPSKNSLHPNAVNFPNSHNGSSLLDLSSSASSSPSSSFSSPKNCLGLSAGHVNSVPSSSLDSVLMEKSTPCLPTTKNGTHYV